MTSRKPCQPVESGRLGTCLCSQSACNCTVPWCQINMDMDVHTYVHLQTHSAQHMCAHVHVRIVVNMCTYTYLCIYNMS